MSNVTVSTVDGSTYIVAYSVLAISVSLIVVALAMITRSTGARSIPGRIELSQPVIVLAAIGGAWAIFATYRGFAFYHDDFHYLIRATLEPWRGFDGQFRVVGVRAPFWLAVQSGHPELVLMALNILAVLGGGWAFATMLQAAGWTSSEAVFAALLFISSRPIVDLAVWGAGFQQILAWGLVFAILHAGIRGASESNQRARLGWTLLAIGLGGIAALTKWKFAWIAGPAAWLWITLNAGSRRDSGARWSVFAGVTALMFLAIVANSGGVHEASTARILLNARDAIESMFGPTLAVAVILVVGYQLQPSDHTFVSFVRERVAPRLAVVRNALIMLPVFVAPFLFNGLYFASYYVGPATAWLAAAAAPVILAVSPKASRGWVTAGILMFFWLPTTPLLDATRSRTIGHDLAVWLEDVRVALVDHPPADAVAIEASCSSEAATRRSDARLRRYFELSEMGEGIRWTTGWIATSVAVGSPTREGSTIQLAYCAETHPRIRVRPDQG